MIRPTRIWSNCSRFHRSCRRCPRQSSHRPSKLHPVAAPVATPALPRPGQKSTGSRLQSVSQFFNHSCAHTPPHPANALVTAAAPVAVPVAAAVQAPSVAAPSSSHCSRCGRPPCQTRRSPVRCSPGRGEIHRGHSGQNRNFATQPPCLNTLSERKLNNGTTSLNPELVGGGGASAIDYRYFFLLSWSLTLSMNGSMIHRAALGSGRIVRTYNWTFSRPAVGYSWRDLVNIRDEETIPLLRLALCSRRRAVIL